MQPQRRLEGRGIIVTGASSGIGWAVAERVAAEGGRVLASGRRRDALDALAAATAGVQPYAADLAGPAGGQALIDEAKRRIGRVDGLVHCAGTVRRGEDVRATTDAAFDRFLDENLTSTFRLVRAAFAEMTANGSGSIVLIGSQLSEIAIPGYATYCTVKGAITSLGRALAVDGGPYGVRVNTLAPGVIRTPMRYVDRENFDELEAGIAERHPLRRIGEPHDVAGPAAFLLSDDAAWITGHTLIVDGGFTIQ